MVSRNGEREKNEEAENGLIVSEFLLYKVSTRDCVFNMVSVVHSNSL